MASKKFPVAIDPDKLRVHRGAYYRAFIKLLEHRKSRPAYIDSIVRVDSPARMTNAEFEKQLAIETKYSMYELRTARLAMIEFEKKGKCRGK